MTTQWVHAGVTITTDEQGRFRYTTDDITNSADTLREAREEIESIAKGNRPVLNKPVLLTDGREAFAYTIHQGTGQWLFRDADGKPIVWEGYLSSTPAAYFPNDVVRDLIAREKTVREELRSVQIALRDHRVELPRGSGRTDASEVFAHVKMARDYYDKYSSEHTYASPEAVGEQA